jgi:restriction system protein
MQDLSKLAILLVVGMNLAGRGAVDGITALAAAVSALAWGLGRWSGALPSLATRQARVTLLARHRAALTKRFRQLVRPNPYGVEELDKWLDELERFRRSTGLPAGGKQARAFDRLATRLVRGWVAEDAEAVLEESESDLSPADYEHHCAALLRRQGWQADVTGMSGDQGADVVAERDGISIALQCKLYARPVGNKAVQEAHAAASYVEAAYAAVVTNAAFTRSAEALAHKLGVFLLHHSELTRLDELIERTADAT